MSSMSKGLYGLLRDKNRPRVSTVRISRQLMFCALCTSAVEKQRQHVMMMWTIMMNYDDVVYIAMDHGVLLILKHCNS